MRWLLKALREAAGEIEDHLYGLDRHVLSQRPAENELSLIEIAAHLRDNEKQVRGWLTLMADTHRHRPQLLYVNVELLPFEHDYRRLDIREVLTEFASLRHHTLMLLWSLEPIAGECYGIHPYQGAISVYDIARELNWHDLQHLWEIRRLREEARETRIDV